MEVHLVLPCQQPVLKHRPQVQFKWLEPDPEAFAQFATSVPLFDRRLEHFALRRDARDFLAEDVEQSAKLDIRENLLLPPHAFEDVITTFPF